MTKWEKVKEDVLIKSKRYCCYCEKYKGRDIEVHHIVQKSDGGEDSFDNAIPFCFDCHSEVGSYNNNHPKGNKFKPRELKKIRDNFYDKVDHLPRKPQDINDDDKNLLMIFKDDYTDLIEYCIRIDFTAELVDISLSDKIENLYYEKWTKKKYKFENMKLEELKIDILNSLNELNEYLTPKFLRVNEKSGNLIFRNQSEEEGNNLREVFRPNSLRIRKYLKKLLDILYSC